MAVARSRWRSNPIDEHGDTGILIATVEQSWELFDQEARALLGISGEEFLQKWDAGEFDQVADSDLARRLNSLLMMLPFVRSTNS